MKIHFIQLYQIVFKINLKLMISIKWMKKKNKNIMNLNIYLRIDLFLKHLIKIYLINNNYLVLWKKNKIKLFLK